MARKTSMEQLGVDVPALDGEPAETEAGEQAEFAAGEETVGVTEDGTEVAVDTAPDAEPEAPAEERPEWLPQQYKTPQDLVASKKALENELRIRGERERELQEQVAQYAESFAQLQQQQTQTQYGGDFEDQLAEAYEQNPLAVMQWMAEQAAQRATGQYAERQQQAAIPQMQAQNEILAKSADQEMSATYADWNDVKDQVGDLLQQRPYLLPDQALGSLRQTTEALDVAYRLVKADGLLAQSEQLRAAGIEQADVDRARKLAAGTLTGATGRPEPLSDADRELAAMKEAVHGSSWAQIREASG